jgi:hypothetical protein
MDSDFIKDFFGQDLQDCLDFFPAFPDENLETPIAFGDNLI